MIAREHLFLVPISAKEDGVIGHGCIFDVLVSWSSLLVIPYSGFFVECLFH